MIRSPSPHAHFQSAAPSPPDASTAENVAAPLAAAIFAGLWQNPAPFPSSSPASLPAPPVTTPSHRPAAASLPSTPDLARTLQGLPGRYHQLSLAVRHDPGDARATPPPSRQTESAVILQDLRMLHREFQADSVRHHQHLSFCSTSVSQIQDRLDRLEQAFAALLSAHPSAPPVSPPLNAPRQVPSPSRVPVPGAF